jgi:hypothetical protein
MTESGFYACELSLRAGESLIATATRVDVWILLECREGYGREAFAESSIPEAVKHHLNQQLKAIPNSRLQLIKQERHSAGPLAFYISVANSTPPRLVQFSLQRYEDLLTFDLPAIVAGQSEPQALSTEPVYLVCTNGKRDKCCTRFGVPTYNELASIVGANAWQTSHLGGHRFAATGVFLPYGVAYGRIANMTQLVESYRKGEIVLEHYRGRSCYAEPVQAAEYYLRRETNQLQLGYFAFVSAQRQDEGHWAVVFHDVIGKQYTIRIKQELTDFAIHKNSDDPERKPVPQFILTGYEPHDAKIG